MGEAGDNMASIHVSEEASQAASLAVGEAAGEAAGKQQMKQRAKCTVTQVSSPKALLTYIYTMHHAVSQVCVLWASYVINLLAQINFTCPGLTG